mmetsp:Transcript_34437/g.75699  ORF Transcript_34437/g.75699 Transcript_34437/m.75699 type:complete len:99 (+) Transcript_34437:2013-2309(+)
MDDAEEAEVAVAKCCRREEVRTPAADEDGSGHRLGDRKRTLPLALLVSLVLTPTVLSTSTLEVEEKGRLHPNNACKAAWGRGREQQQRWHRCILRSTY